ncbi:hypothetical protein CO683_38750 [Bradyrhizobium ottawaense]|nr:hypothetical protein CO683_38750 [Bradyrhizobium ottawaense]
MASLKLDHTNLKISMAYSITKLTRFGRSPTPDWCSAGPMTTLMMEVTFEKPETVRLQPH